jgi:hypothetical protein
MGVGHWKLAWDGALGRPFSAKSLLARRASLCPDAVDAGRGV